MRILAHNRPSAEVWRYLVYLKYWTPIIYRKYYPPRTLAPKHMLAYSALVLSQGRSPLIFLECDYPGLHVDLRCNSRLWAVNLFQEFATVKRTRNGQMQALLCSHPRIVQNFGSEQVWTLHLQDYRSSVLLTKL